MGYPGDAVTVMVPLCVTPPQVKLEKVMMNLVMSVPSGFTVNTNSPKSVWAVQSPLCGWALILLFPLSNIAINTTLKIHCSSFRIFIVLLLYGLYLTPHLVGSY
jgi:hypothetical protein